MFKLNPDWKARFVEKLTVSPVAVVFLCLVATLGNSTVVVLFFSIAVLYFLLFITSLLGG